MIWVISWYLFGIGACAITTYFEGSLRPKDIAVSLLLALFGPGLLLIAVGMWMHDEVDWDRPIWTWRRSDNG
jgi:hypothetical protein